MEVLFNCSNPVEGDNPKADHIDKLKRYPCICISLESFSRAVLLNDPGEECGKCDVEHYHREWAQLLVSCIHNEFTREHSHQVESQVPGKWAFFESSLVEKYFHKDVEHAPHLSIVDLVHELLVGSAEVNQDARKDQQLKVSEAVRAELFLPWLLILDGRPFSLLRLTVCRVKLFTFSCFSSHFQLKVN